jgi:phenylalanyl-tRNA synthetase alpha chain
VIVDQTQIDLQSIGDGGSCNGIKDLVKRKLIEKVRTFSYSVAKGVKFTKEVEKEEADITAEMMQNGSWKTAAFKQYNFNAKGTVPESGHLHPLLKVRAEFRQIFFELGYAPLYLMH